MNQSFNVSRYRVERPCDEAILNHPLSVHDTRLGVPVLDTKPTNSSSDKAHLLNSIFNGGFSYISWVPQYPTILAIFFRSVPTMEQGSFNSSVSFRACVNYIFRWVVLIFSLYIYILVVYIGGYSLLKSFFPRGKNTGMNRPGICLFMNEGFSW